MNEKKTNVCSAPEFVQACFGKRTFKFSSAAKQTINRMSVFWCSGQIRNPSTFVVTLPNLAQANANTHPILNYINLTYTKIEKEARGLIGIIKKSKVQPFDTHFNHH